MATSKEFDLFGFLEKLGSRNLNAYTNLSDEEKKQASPLIIARWLTGTNDAAQIIRMNEAVNPFVFSLGSHKELLFKLMASASTGNTRRYSWKKMPSSNSEKLKIEVIKQSLGISTREAKMYADTFKDPTQLVQAAEELGWSKDQIKKLQGELGLELPSKKASKK